MLQVFDAHSDIWSDVTRKRLAGQPGALKNFHLPRLRRGHVTGTILALWVEPEFAHDPASRLLSLISTAIEELALCRSEIRLVLESKDLSLAQSERKLAVVLGVEGLDFVKRDLGLLSLLYELGVRHATLTWNEANALATGVHSPDKNRGLTPLGRQAVMRLNELGVLLDVSHLNEKSFWDLIEIAQGPVIASHSNAWALCPVSRNLKDEQIKAIAQRGGVIGVNAWPEFVDAVDPSLEKLADHVDYMVSLVGIDHVGCGFDFCDYLMNSTLASFSEVTQTTRGLEDVTKVPNLFSELSRRGYDTVALQKIARDNFCRVITQVLQRSVSHDYRCAQRN